MFGISRLESRFRLDRLAHRCPQIHQHSVEAYEEAYEGRRGGVLWATSAVDGRKLAEIKLDAAPVWDGMAAAGEHLYLATKDGKITCFHGKR